MPSARLVDRLYRLLATEQAEQRLPSVVAGVVRDGELVWAAGRGRLADGTVPGPTTQYRCGSVTKTFVAVCVMRLRDEGALALTDRLEDHLPDTGAGAATIAQLLSHGSGLRAETAGPWWERTPGGDLPALIASSLADGQGGRFETGRRFHYSNVGFGLLGALVARLRRASWYEVVTGELLRPLGMTRTTTRPLPNAAPGLAVHPWADVTLPEPEHDAGAMAPAGQLWSTAEDLGRWAGFLAGATPGPLAPDSLAEMREPRVVDDRRGQRWSAAYGLGLQVFNDGGRRTFGHGGSMPGFRAGLEVTEDGDGAIALANATTGLRGELTAELLTALREELPRLPAEWRPEAPPVDLEALGAWYWGPAPHLLRARAGLLELSGVNGGGRPSCFRPTGPDRWVGLDGYHAGEPLTIVRHPDGSVSHLDIGSFVFTRQPYDPGGPVPGGVSDWGPPAAP